MPPRPPLATATSADVVVVGGGIAGVATAYACAARGARAVCYPDDGEVHPARLEAYLLDPLRP